jgi:hypothetical protein
MKLKEKSIWITSPFDRRNKVKDELLWVAGEDVEVKVLVSNPFAFKLPLDSIELTYRSSSSSSSSSSSLPKENNCRSRWLEECSTAGVPFETRQQRLVLPASSPVFKLVLSGRPLAEGGVIIKGLSIAESVQLLLLWMQTEARWRPG